MSDGVRAALERVDQPRERRELGVARACAAEIARDAHIGKNVEVGRGVMDVRAIMQALVDIKFQDHVGFEYEKDADDPLPGLAESVGYVRGIVAGLQ